MVKEKKLFQRFWRYKNGCILKRRRGMELRVTYNGCGYVSEWEVGVHVAIYMEMEDVVQVPYLAER